MKNFKVAAIVAAIFITVGAGCGSGASGNSSDGNSSDSNESGTADVMAGVPGWIKGPWAMVRWNNSDVTRFDPTMTIADSSFSSAFNDIGAECVSDGSLVMEENTPSWETNEYSMIVSESTCLASWGPASLSGEFDQGAMFTESERALLRVSYLYPDFWQYKRE